MKTRILGEGCSCYHVFSRIIERRFYLGSNEKNVFRDMMWRVAEFSGVRILTYCIMDNHFHILVEIPEPEHIDDAELLRRLRMIYRGHAWSDLKEEYDRSGCSKAWREAFRAKYLKRMYSLSEFMRTLKLRFSFWYNRNHEREGTLWDARFRSVLVQGSSRTDNLGSGNLALMTVAAYIDLNAVRAGIVEDPRYYHWCGYGEAVAGKRNARKGLRYLYGVHEGQLVSWRKAGGHYRSMLLEKGCRTRYDDPSGVSLGRHVRHFTAGVVLGSEEFVNKTFRENRSFFSARRKDGARRIGEIGEGNMYAMRDLRPQ